MPFDASFTRYLAAKKSVDDRALNAHVWRSLAARLATSQQGQSSVRVLEVGAGIGAMIERLLEDGMLTRASYHAIDAEAENIIMASARLRAWAVGQGYVVEEEEEDRFRLVNAALGRSVSIHLERCDALELAGRRELTAGYDLLIAHAFLDLLDLPTALPRLLRLLRPGGLVYAAINFDGATIFEPAINPKLDAQIERLYHQTMDQRLIDGRASGDSRTGRHLFASLPVAGVQILAAGSSDWVVYANGGQYPQDEAYFLHFIVTTVHGALRGHPELDHVAFDEWITARHRQIEAGDLVYIAHQLDFLGEKVSVQRNLRG